MSDVAQHSAMSGGGGRGGDAVSAPRPRAGTPGGPGRRSYRYLDLLTAGFVTVLLCSNLIGPAKVTVVLGISFGVGNLFFPISYIFGDVLTEVYGYARARRVIWTGFAALVFAAVMSAVVLHMPLDPKEPNNARVQPAIETLFGGTWRIVVASTLAFLIGDFVNSYLLAKMKVWTQGRWLWTRTIGSTVAGQGVDSLVFYPLAFAGVWEADTLASVIIANWLFKVAVEVVMTPVTYRACAFLKAREGEDFFDRSTDFTPFRI